jgi:RES domain-containing protein
VRYQGALYRALNPIWARDPLSGEGARRHGGRFNPRGLPALYTSLSVVAAIREAHQVGSLQPTLLVAYEADVAPVFDATGPDALARHGLTPAALADDGWRLRMLAHGKAPTQAFAERLIADGHAGMLVPSFARGATAADRNLVLWRWGPELPARLVLVDDERRLR